MNATASLVSRLWVYQAERFPLIRTIPLLAVFSAASVTTSARFAGRPLPGLWAYFVAFLLAFTVFWQLRAADEAKDFETDCLYRPERPVPRGLVSLRLIVGLGLLASVPALLAAWSLSKGVVVLLLIVWGWLGLMTAEFFMPRLLHSSPLLYLVSHMAIMPLIDLTLTGCEWVPAGAAPTGLWTFLAMSFCNGCVLEFGRKIWAPGEEREGVETYSSAWGLRRSLLVLALATAGAFLSLGFCGLYLARPVMTLACGIVVALAFAAVLVRFARKPDRRRQKQVEAVSGIWVLVCYLAAAFTPILSVGP